MKKLSSLIVVMTLVLATIGTAEARHNSSVEGLLLGAGSGAIIGQAVAGDVEGVIIGSMIGGTLGVLIANDMDRGHTVIVNRPQPVPRIRVVHTGRLENRHVRRSYDRHCRTERHERHGRQQRTAHRR